MSFSAALIVLSSIRKKPNSSTDLEQRSDVHIKTQVSKPRGDDFGASVVAVLTHLCHQQTWVPALVPLKICYSKKNKNKTKTPGLDGLNQRLVQRCRGESGPVVSHGDLLLLPVLAAVGAAHHPGAGFVFTKHGLHGISDLTDGASRQRREQEKGASANLTWSCYEAAAGAVR